MGNKLYIIGNGLDIAHNLPTYFDPDFKKVAEKVELGNFWELYQSRDDDIWSDFENLLAHPDFNALEEIFSGCEPDYASDRESDRDGIIDQVWINGNLGNELSVFANNAEKAVYMTKPIEGIKSILDPDGYYVTMNYTHTLEFVYGIPQENVLHIHGEVGKNNLILGYPEGNFEPESYNYDVRQKGRGPYRKVDIENFINSIEDYYVHAAYLDLYNKCKAFSKSPQIDVLDNYLSNKHCEIAEIIVFGHSCAIDFDYFNYLNNKYNKALWTFYVKGDRQKDNVDNLIKKYNILNKRIVWL